MTTIATMLSGGEGVGVGARAAGLRHLWGVEADARIASVAQANGFHAIIARIQDVDPSTLAVPDVLHASPECQRASQARQADEGGRESPLDIEIGNSVCDYLRVLRPRIFTLENVWGYRDFTAFQGICATLSALGYFYHYANVNAADFGVPQTRRRLILRAVRGGLLPQLPAPEPWIGWYQAIEDLIPGLPESQFAPWQLKRLPEALGQNTLLSNHFGDPKGSIVNICPEQEPVHTVSALNPFRAFITDITNSVNAERPPTLRDELEPTMTVTAAWGWRPSQMPRAFIINSVNARQEYSDGLRYKESPAMTITKEAQPRAWLSQGRVVKMTPRCLARFQSFPDSYVLPDNNALACRVIGNAVPPLLYQKIISQLIGAIHA